MFDLKWAQPHNRQEALKVKLKPSKVVTANIESTLDILWEEHCVECAVPECYNNCSLFIKRKDNACARFVYGIFPNKNFNGRYNFGAEIKFRKWGKIEAILQKKNNQTLKFPYFDEFILECYSPHKKNFKLILEYFTEKVRFRKSLFRHSFNIEEGYNLFAISRTLFNMKHLEGYVCLYPENSIPEKKIIFTWLDFVKYHKDKLVKSTTQRPKIKCVAWDLDNTIWFGILSENNEIIPNTAAMKLIKQLDNRGIIQTITSKNDFEPAWEKLKELKLEKYFVYPGINWGQKSENLLKIAEHLNINLDTFALIDDSYFEREEIANSLPMVRVFSGQQIPEIIKLEDFNHPITIQSKKRRLNYLAAVERAKIKESFSEDYDSFLISCKMKLEAFVPKNSKAISRCLELIQRSNQLNLSTIRHSEKEFKQLFNKGSLLNIALKCQDRFGNYGIIGFVSIEIKKTNARLKDFVISCRVAQKKVEHTFIKSISMVLQKEGVLNLSAVQIKTEKNRPLQKVFSDLPFSIIEENETLVKFNMKINISNFKDSEVMESKLDSSILSNLQLITRTFSNPK